MTGFIKQNFGPLVVGLAIGYAAAMGTIVGTVTRSEAEIVHLKEVNAQIRSDFSDERVRTDKRIFELAALIRDAISQNQQLVEVLQVQNKLLERQGK